MKNVKLTGITLANANGKLRVILDVEGLDDRDVIKLNGTADHRCFDLQRLCKAINIPVSKTGDEETACNLYEALQAGPIEVQLEIGKTDNKTFNMETKTWVTDEAQYETYTWVKEIDLSRKPAGKK